MTVASEIPFAQQQRLRFIESVVLWEGAIQRQRVRDAFDISANHVSKDFLLYKERFPGNLEYDQSAKEYRPSDRFKPALASGKPEEYLALLQAYVESGSDVALQALGAEGIAADTVPAAPVAIDRDVLRDVVRAIRRARGLEATYFSMRAGEGKRHIWPHALVHSGFRWHVRAYDDHDKAFRDLTLTRLVKTRSLDLGPPVPSDKDTNWHTRKVLEIVPRSPLSAAQKAIVGREFGMRQSKTAGWVWSCRLREALIPYFLHRYRLDIEPGKTRIRIELRDREAFRKYFFQD